jgi:hypothetical protein
LNLSTLNILDMKKGNALVFILFFWSIVVAQAPDISRLYSEKELTYFGLDFTKAALCGNFSVFGDESYKPSVIRDKYMVGWNRIVAKEKDKYNFKDAYKKESVNYDIEVTINRNNAIDTTKIFEYINKDLVSPHLTQEDIAKIVKKYDYSNVSTGLGLVYVVDFFNKNNEEGCIWVVFFDVVTKKIIHAEAFKEKAGGIGLRNYWARTVYNTLNTSKDAYKGKWKKLLK